MKKNVKLNKLAYKLDKGTIDKLQEDLNDYNLTIDKCDVLRKNLNIEQKESKVESNEEERTAIMYVSTRTVDQVGDVIVPKGVNLQSYIKNGSPLFFNHDYSKPPIGSDEWIKADSWGIKAKSKFADTGEGTLADIMWKLVKQGHQKQSSVGIIPLEYVTANDDGFKEIVKKLKEIWPEFKKSAKNCRRIITKSILFEHSLVSLACNDDTTVESVSKMYQDAGADEALLKQLGIPFDETDEAEEEEVFEINPEKIEKSVEEKEEKEEKEEYECECIECAHKMKSDQHCKDIKCPKCGGTMRRAKRPGPGQPSEEKEEKEEKKEEKKKPVRKATLVKEPQIVKLIKKPEPNYKELVKDLVQKEIKRKKGRLL